MKKEFIKPTAETMQVEVIEQILVGSKPLDQGHFGGGEGYEGDRARKQDNPSANPADKTMPQGIEF